MFKVFSVVFLSAALLFSNILVAQEPELNFMNLGSREGLSSNIVSDIIKDRYGYMWFATDDGLNKFDGSQFTIYRHKATDSTSIASNDIHDLYEDDQGNFWIATGAGLVRYNRTLDSFVHYKIGALAGTSVCSDVQGNVWMGTYGGLLIFDKNTGLPRPFNVKTSGGAPVLQQTVVRILKDKRGLLWFATERGLYSYSAKKKRITYYNHSDKKPGTIIDSDIKALAEDDGGRIWVGTNGGLSMIHADLKTITNYRHNPGNSNSLSSNIIYSLAADASGKIWVGTEEGLNILNPSNGSVNRVLRNSRNKYSIVGKSVKALYVDNQGICWVSTFRGGINKYDRNLSFFNLRQSNPYDPFGLSAPVVTSFAEAPGGNVYVGTDGGGLNLFDIRSGFFKPIKLSGDAGGALSILTMERAGNEIWIGTFLNGVYVYDITTSNVRRYSKGSGAGSISGNDIFAIKKDSHGNVWVGTNGQGVDRYNPETGKFENFSKNAPGNHRIQLNGYVRAIEEDQEGKIWIGSSGSGLAVYNPATGMSKSFTRASSQLPSDNILSICAAADGVVWIGTGGEGLAGYDQEKGVFMTFSEKDGLANGVIYKVVEDRSGKLWVSTNKGISSFDPATNKFKNYSYYNGLQRNPFVHGAGLKTTSGMLFFGGTDGFNYFQPEKLHSNRNVPKVVLTDLKISNRSVAPSEDSEISEHISIAKEIQLDYKQNFSLGYVALNYTSPHENRYLYKLEKFDKDWNNVGSVNTAVYTNLDPGTYVFHVKAMSESGDWTTPTTSIKIYVRPPFWRTYLAYALYFIFIASLLWYIRRRGIQRLKAKFAIEQERLQVQQMIEQERREAERLHEFDELKIKFLTNLSHEFRTPISLIMGPVEQLLQMETAPKKTEQLSMVRRNARRLLNLVNQLLDFRNVEEKELRLNKIESDFIAFVRDVAESFRDLSARRGINFEFRSGVTSCVTSFDPEKLERALFNLLSNAFKFTLKDGEINLKIELSPGTEGLQITLSDTGVGIEEEAQEKVFERFFQSNSGVQVLNQGSGIGLSITKEFIKMHGGTIDLESIPGKGTTFIINLPLVRIETFDEPEPEPDNTNETPENSADEQPFEELAQIEETSAFSPLPVVLLVEDNDDFRFYLKDNLKTFYKIVEASNGKEGWQKVLSAHPQLVVSDISMPVVSGIELCQKIKADKRTSHIPVLLLTALTGEEDQLKGLEIGANDYMTKPFNFNILNVKIRNLLALNERLKSTYTKQIKVLAPEMVIESENEKLVTKVIQYIEENLTNPQLSVEDLARKVGMSRGSLYTKILEVTGETPVEFIRSVKLDKAAVLLEKSDMNIAQISYAAGFSTPNYFARAFKARFNMLPSEYVSLKRS